MKRCCVLVLCIVGVLAGDAHAFVKYVPLTIDMPEVDVPMHTSKRTKIDMPEIINHWDAGNRHDYNVTRNSTKKSLGIELRQRRAPPSNSNFESANWSVSLCLRPVDTFDEAVSAVIFYVPTV